MIIQEQVEETIQECEYMIEVLKGDSNIEIPVKKLDIERYQELLHYARGLKRCLGYFN